MEAIKVLIDVRVDLSENTQNFIKSLFAREVCACSCTPITSYEETPNVQANIAAPAAVPAETQNDVKPAPSVPAAQVASSASKSIEDMRAMLAKKVNEHRDVIKQKLNELGAPSVTKLDPSKYDEMYNFLESL